MPFVPYRRREALNIRQQPREQQALSSVRQLCVNGKGVLLGSDTIFVNPDRRSVSFMRSFPNRIPLSTAVVECVTKHIESCAFDRLYGNFETVIDTDARAVVRRSAARQVGRVRGDFDHPT